MPSVFCTRQLPKIAFEQLKGKCNIECWEQEQGPPKEELLKRAKGKDALITMISDKVDKELLDACGPQLKLIAQYSVGYDNVDLKECTKRGITVTTTPGVCSESVAETALALMLAAGRHILCADKFIREGNWKVNWHPLMMLGQEINGSTVGIIGCGSIGQHLAKAVMAMGAKAIYHDVMRIKPADDLGIQKVSIEELCKQSDFISIHCNLTNDTKHIIDASHLGLMKKNCVLVNTSRGPIINEKDLYDALSNKTIAAAGLDVFEQEPTQIDNPLLKLDNIVILPHLGSATVKSRDDMAKLLVQNIVAFFGDQAVPSAVNEKDVLDSSKRRRHS